MIGATRHRLESPPIVPIACRSRQAGRLRTRTTFLKPQPPTGSGRASAEPRRRRDHRKRGIGRDVGRRDEKSEIPVDAKSMKAAASSIRTRRCTNYVLRELGRRDAFDRATLAERRSRAECAAREGPHARRTVVSVARCLIAEAERRRRCWRNGRRRSEVTTHYDLVSRAPTSIRCRAGRAENRIEDRGEHAVRRGAASTCGQAMEALAMLTDWRGRGRAMSSRTQPS